MNTQKFSLAGVQRYFPEAFKKLPEKYKTEGKEFEYYPEGFLHCGDIYWDNESADEVWKDERTLVPIT